MVGTQEGGSQLGVEEGPLQMGLLFTPRESFMLGAVHTDWGRQGHACPEDFPSAPDGAVEVAPMADFICKLHVSHTVSE